ncbi:MAG: CAP domain-containing protein [Nanoarchaeota archaeon]|nr:CAP domain-containing protein [Nanoarchaeota archaeon]
MKKPIKFLIIFLVFILFWQGYKNKEGLLDFINKLDNRINEFIFTEENLNKIEGVLIETKDYVTGKPEINISELEWRIHELVNVRREEQGLRSLQYDFELVEIAKNHSKDMVNNGFFDHVSLNGESPSDRAKKAGYTCYKNYGTYFTEGIAENIFQNNLYTSVTYLNGIPVYDWNSLEDLAYSTVQGWMDSSGHRQNILNQDYEKEGIGVVISSNNELLITQNFC